MEQRRVGEEGGKGDSGYVPQKDLFFFFFLVEDIRGLAFVSGQRRFFVIRSCEKTKKRREGGRRTGWGEKQKGAGQLRKRER